MKTYGKAKITTEKGKIIIQPIQSGIMRLAGKYKMKNPIPAEKIREHIWGGNL